MKQKISIPMVDLIFPTLLFAFFVCLQIQSMIFPIVISVRNASIQLFANALSENNEMVELFFPSHIFLNHKSDPTDSMAPISGLIKEIHLLCNIYHTGCVVLWNWNYIFLQLVLENKYFKNLPPSPIY